MMAGPEPMYRVMLIEPDEGRAERLAMRLREEGVAVERAATSERAIVRLALGAAADAAIVTLDPAIAAELAILAGLSQARSQMSIVAATPDGGSRDRAIVLAAGAHECIARADIDSPLLPRLLVHAVERARAEALAAGTRSGRATDADTAAEIENDTQALLAVGETGAVLFANKAARGLLAQRGKAAGTPSDVVLHDPAPPPGAASGETRIVWRGVPARLLAISEGGALEQAAETALTAQKSAAAGILAGGLAHDFNNLLLVIMGNAEFLIAASGEGAPERAMAERINAAAERARQLTRQLLMFMRAQPGAPVVLDPAGAIRTLFDLLRRSIPRTVNLVFVPPDKVWPVKADRHGLDQVLVNLVLNAHHAMPKGGRIEITVANLTLEAAQAPLAAGDYVRIDVADSGEGIRPENLAHVFEPFFSTRDAEDGTGLGLTVSRQLVREMGGDIRVRSKRGEGAVFSVILPRARGGRLATARAVEAVDVAGSESILVVDDDAAVAETLRAALEARGYTATVAGDGQHALRLVEEGGPFDLVLCDKVMPLMTGVELAGRLAATHPGLPVLLMSGHGDTIPPPDDGHPAVPEIAKPFTPQEGLARIRALLDRR